MPNFACSLHRLTGLRSLAARRLLTTLAASGGLALTLAAAPALAVVTPIGAPQFGVVPRSVANYKEPTLPLTYHGGPVMHTNNTYAIYWDPAQKPQGRYDGDWKEVIDQYFQDMGQASGALENVFAVAAQYTDSQGTHVSNNSTFRGARTDLTPYPASGCSDPEPSSESFVCLTDSQVRGELNIFLAANGLQRGLGTVFFLLTPPGVTICTDAGGSGGHCSGSSGSASSYEKSFCSYHSYLGSGTNTVLYAVQPWVAGKRGSFDGLGTSLGGADCQRGFAPLQEPNQLGSRDLDGDFDRGLPDVIINQISMEQFATMTDPTLDGWYAPSGQANAGNEAPDQCRNWFAPVLGGTEVENVSSANESFAGTLFDQIIAGHKYYLNTAYDQAALTVDFPGVACIPGNLFIPHFTAPSPVNPGDIVGFDGTESTVSLGATNYAWNFGDGTPVVSGPPSSDQSVFHSFAVSGPHTVTLTITDQGTNTATVSQVITVTGTPPPPGELGKEEGPGPGGASTSTPGSPGSPAGSPASPAASTHTPPIVVLPDPIASAAIASKSLGQVLRNGLVVRYSVNEQVAGRFEVLLAASIARRLGIHGPPATGLPAGSAPAVVIARAVLVTTKGGHSSVKILFDKRTAARLHKLRKVSLTLRMTVRNASTQSPKSVTVLSTITLHR